MNKGKFFSWIKFIINRNLYYNYFNVNKISKKNSSRYIKDKIINKIYKIEEAIQ